MPLIRSHLSTDMVDSTSTRERLSETRFAEVSRELDEIVGSVVAGQGGELLKHRGDGWVVGFRSSSAAIETAVQTQRRLDYARRCAAELPHVRLGIATVDSDGTSTPSDTFRAEAICEMAGTDEILVDALTIELAGSWVDRRSIHFAPATDGLVRIQWTPPAPLGCAVGLPPILDRDDIPCVGRQPRVDAVVATYDKVAREGRAAVIVVEGEGGIGKTTTLAHGARAILDRGAMVVGGRCDDRRVAAFRPAADAMRQFRARAPFPEVELGDAAWVWSTVVPELSEGRSPDVPAAWSDSMDRLVLFDSFATWVQRCTRQQPVLFVVEDLHWAEQSMLALLGDLLERCVRHPLLIAVSITTSEEGRATAGRLLSEIVPDEVPVVEVDLEPLTLADLRLMAESLDHRPADAQLARVHRLSGGNPLFAWELLRSEATGAAADSELPKSIQTTVERQLGRLSPDDRTVLETAAVLGRDFELRQLRRVSPENIDVLQCLERLCDSRFIEPLAGTSAFTFAHDITRAVVYQYLSPIRRMGLHERAALALKAATESDPTVATATEIAHHFVEAVALGHRAGAIDASIAAGNALLDQSAVELAEVHFRRGADLAEGLENGERARCAALIGLGSALRRNGDPTYSAILDEAGSVAMRLDDGRLIGESVLAGHRGTFTNAVEVNTVTVDRLERALALASGHDAWTARLMAKLAMELVWDDPRRSVELCRSAVALAHELGDVRAAGAALSAQQWCLFDPIEDRVDSLAELDRVAAASGDLFLQFEAASCGVFTAARRGDRTGLDDALARTTDLAMVIDEPLVHWMALIRRATYELMGGRYDSARALADRCYDLSRMTSQPDAEGMRQVQRFWIGMDNIPVGRAAGRLAALAANIGDIHPTGRGAIVHGCAEAGLLDEARSALPTLGDPDRWPRNEIWLWNVSQMAIIAARVSDPGRAAMALDLLDGGESEHANMTFASMGSVARPMALACEALGRSDRASELFEVALASNRSMALPAWTARTCLDWAAGRDRASPRSADAEALRSEARGLIDAHGITAIAHRL